MAIATLLLRKTLARQPAGELMDGYPRCGEVWRSRGFGTRVYIERVEVHFDEHGLSGLIFAMDPGANKLEYQLSSFLRNFELSWRTMHDPEWDA